MAFLITGVNIMKIDHSKKLTKSVHLKLFRILQLSMDLGKDYTNAEIAIATVELEAMDWFIQWETEGRQLLKDKSIIF